MIWLQTKGIYEFLNRFEEVDKAYADIPSVPSTPIIVKIFTVVGAWVAALTFMALLGMLHVLDGAQNQVIIGAFSLICSVVFSRFLGSMAIFEPLSVATSVIGFGLLMVGLTHLYSDRWVFGFCFLLASALLFLVRNPLQWLLLGLTALGSLAVFIYKPHNYAIHVMVGLNVCVLSVLYVLEAHFMASAKWLLSRLEMLGYAHAIFLLGTMYVAIYPNWEIDMEHHWVLSILLGVGIAVQVGSYFRHPLLVLLAVLLCGCLWLFPSILAGVFVLLLGTLYGDRILAVLGLLGVVYFVVCSYYNMDIPLLTKSYYMLLTGVAMLIVAGGMRWWLLHKKSELPTE